MKKLILSDDHDLCIRTFLKAIEELRPNMGCGCVPEKKVDSFFESTGFTKQLAIYHELRDQNGRFPAREECLWQR